MSAFQDSDEIAGQRSNTHLTIYSAGTAVINEQVNVRWRTSPKEQTALSQSGSGNGKLFGLFGGGRATQQGAFTQSATAEDENQRQREGNNLVRTIRVDKVSNAIDLESLFTSEVSAGDRSLRGVLIVESSEVKNTDGRTSVREILEQSKGRLVNVTDVSGRSDELVTFEGVLDDIHSNVLVLRTPTAAQQQREKAPATGVAKIGSDQGLTIVELPNRAAVQFPDSDKFDWNVLRPYLQLRVLYQPGAIGDNTVLSIPVVYETGGVSFRMAYMFIVEQDEQTMSVGMKAQIQNNTTSDFDGAQISLVEIEQPTEETKKRYARRPRYQQRYEKATLYATARGVPSSTVAPSDDFEPPTVDQDKGRSQKTFRIKDRGVPVDLKSNTSQSFIIHQTPDAGVGMRMDYVFKPQKHPTNIKMQLVFANEQQNNLGFSLPRGEATVMKRETTGSLSRLGDAMIGKKHDKKVVRLSLGIANTITARLEELGTDEDKARNAKIYKWNLFVKNTQNQPVRVTLKMRFADKGWEVVQGSEIDFEVDKPDNPKTEKWTALDARGVVEAPAFRESKFSFAVAVPN